MADFLLTSDAARVLNVAAQTIRDYCDSGVLRATKTANGTRIIAKADVERLRAKRLRPRGSDEAA